jgi:TetR/AcrR family transcriptional regulator, multidrug resistance operon repressor
MEPIAEKKRAIFESTLKLVRENGFHGTPMSMVAKHAGVAAGTIYHYFGSKDQLIEELFTYVQQQVIAVIKKENCETISFKACFFNLWFGLYSFYRENPDVLKFFEQFVNSPYNTARPSQEQDELHELLSTFFERGIREEQLKPIGPNVLGTLMHSNIISTVRLVSSGWLILERKELELIPQIFWDGMQRTN